MKKLCIVLFSTILLAACGQEESNHGDHSLEPIEVDIQAPEEAIIGDELSLEAVVTHDGEVVEDGEVTFEVWLEDNRDASKMIEAEHEGDGVYVIEHTFEHPGEYTIQAHTDARGMHHMPMATIVVKEGNTE